MFHVVGNFFSSNFAAGFGPKVKAIFRFGNRPKPRDSAYNKKLVWVVDYFSVLILSKHNIFQ